MATINTAKQFASCFTKGRARYVRVLDESTLELRLEAIRNFCARATSCDIYGDNALPQGYNPASYGLWWVVASGRVNGETAMALRAMTVRQLCELVHTLLVRCGPTTERYAHFLMEQFSLAA